MENMHSFWQLGDELRGHSKASEDHKWLMVASKLAEQRSKVESFNNLDLSKGPIETRPRDKFGFPEENKFDTLNLSILNLESKFIENMNKSSLRNGVYNMNAVYQKNNANMLDNMNSNKCSGNVQLNKDPHSNNNNNNVNNNMTYSKRHTTVPESPHTNVTSTRRKQKRKFFLSMNIENQSSTTSSSMQFLILEQVQFLTVNDDSLLQWELVDVVDIKEEEEMVDDVERESFVSWAVASPIGDPIEGLNHGLLHLDDRFSEEQVRVNRDVVDDEDDDDVDDEEDDLDDELVPWDIGNKLGRQRMRKLGKRVSSKMNNSKRSPYLFVSPGCVRGKHGMGLKHCF